LGRAAHDQKHIVELGQRGAMVALDSGAHFAAAAWHHFVRSDRVVSRMIGGTQG